MRSASWWRRNRGGFRTIAARHTGRARVSSPAQAHDMGAAIVDDARARRVVRVVQGPAAAGTTKLLANAAHKAGGCIRVPHQARRTVCAARYHSRGARDAGERETGLSRAGPSWAELGWGLAGAGMARKVRAGLGMGAGRARSWVWPGPGRA
jgi:hypothetical protein